MRSLTRLLIAALLLLPVFWLTITLPVRSQSSSDVDDQSKLIVEAFNAAHLPPPELGWILPSGDVVTEVSSKEITILAAKRTPQVAPQIGVIPAKDIQAFVRKNEVDCDQMDEEKPSPLYRYDAKLPASAGHYNRVFVLAGGHGDAVQTGFQELTPTAKEMMPVLKAISFGAGQKKRIRSVSQSGTALFLIFADTYSKNGDILRSGVFLENHDGQILAKRIENINGENQCDGCGVQTYRDAAPPAWGLENLIAIPGLPYPIILEDSSTVELRAKDLLAFSQQGEPSEYRKYEYVVTCELANMPEEKPRKPKK